MIFNLDMELHCKNHGKMCVAPLACIYKLVSNFVKILARHPYIHVHCLLIMVIIQSWMLSRYFIPNALYTIIV